MDGSPRIRTVSTVEALLILSEWPLVAMATEEERRERESGDNPLMSSMRYDAMAWSHVGWAVRLAQDLGMHNHVFNLLSGAQTRQDQWQEERIFRTWVYCYNADRHLSVRLGRNAVVQSYMSSRWWEHVSDLASRNVREKGTGEMWVEDIYAPALVACLMGAIQDQLYSHKEVTRSLLRTGLWEHFLRSLKLEIAFIRRSCNRKLAEKSIDAALLHIEIDYAVLYANAIALRALQEKLRRRRKADDLYYNSPSLLNLIEGPWIMDAMTAARSIITISVQILEKKGVLRYCPSRIAERIMFAATFLYKALGVGVVEHGQHTIIDALDSAVKAILRASLDEEHFIRGFAQLLLRLGRHWRGAKATDKRFAKDAQPANAPGSQSTQSPVTIASMPDPASIFPGPDTCPKVSGATDFFDFGREFDSRFLQQAQQPTQTLNEPTFYNFFDFGSTSLSGQMTQPIHSFDPIIFSGVGGPSDVRTSQDIGWRFDPSESHREADREQEALFQSLWGIASTGSGGMASGVENPERSRSDNRGNMDGRPLPDSTGQNSFADIFTGDGSMVDKNLASHGDFASNLYGTLLGDDLSIFGM